MQEEVLQVGGGAKKATETVVNEMINGVGGLSSAQQKLAKESVVATFDQVINLLGDKKNVNDPYNDGAFTQKIRGSKDQESYDEKLTEIQGIVEKWGTLNPTKKYEIVTKNNNGLANNLLTLLNTEASASLGNTLMSAINANNKQNGYFQSLSQNENIKESKARFSNSVRSLESYNEYYPKVKAEVIQGYKESNEPGSLKKSYMLDAAINTETGKVKPFAEYLESYSKTLDSQNISPNHKAGLINEAFQFYYGKHTWKDTSRGANELKNGYIAYYGKVALETSKTMMGYGSQEAVNELVMDKLELENFAKQLLINDELGYKDETSADGISGIYQKLIGDYAKNSSGILIGLGDTYASAINMTNVTGTDRMTMGYQGTRAYHTDVIEAGTDAIYSIGDFKNSKTNFNSGDTYAPSMGLSDPESEVIKTIYDNMMTAFVSDVDPKKENRLIANVKYQQTALSTNDYVGLNIKPNELWVKKYLGTEKVEGSARKHWENVRDKGLTVYLPRHLAKNALTKEMSNQPLDKAFKTTGEINVYAHDNQSINLVRNSDGTVSLKGYRYAYDEKSESGRSMVEVDRQYPAYDETMSIKKLMNELSEDMGALNKSITENIKNSKK
jgi:hypothetical protein